MADLSPAVVAGLRAAFRGEAMTASRYTYFAQMAEVEGQLGAATLFRDLAESVATAAHGHIDFLRQISDPATGRPIGETHLNLASASVGELREASDLYPRLAAAAHADGLADVASWMETLGALKRAHVAKLEAALAALTQR